VDGAGLKKVTAEVLAKGMQHSEQNPLAGISVGSLLKSPDLNISRLATAKPSLREKTLPDSFDRCSPRECNIPNKTHWPVLKAAQGC
jgi:hypothetical protein